MDKIKNFKTLLTILSLQPSAFLLLQPKLQITTDDSFPSAFSLSLASA
jgi:hypothetical protein